MWKINFKILSVLMLAFVSIASQARTFVYNGNSDDVVVLEEAPSLGKDIYLMEIKGIEHAWADKVFKVKRKVNAGREQFSFDYKVELSSGVQNKNYTVVAEKGKTLINGSLIKQIELQMDLAEAETLNHSAEESKKAVKGALLEKFQKDTLRS